jgi:SNF2 family DNA or RNA helicase
VPNGEFELYSQLTFLDENSIPLTYQTFIKSICDVGNRFSDYAINFVIKKKAEIFIDSVKHYFVKRELEEYLDIPEQTKKKYFIYLSKKQQQIYRLFCQYTLNIIKEESGVITTKQVDQKFPYLMQALYNPCMLKNKIDKEKSRELFNLVEQWKFSEHSKLEYLDDMVLELVGEKKEKIIICSYHPLTCNQLAEHYKKYNPLVIHGQIEDSLNQKMLLIEEFKKDKNKKILIVNPQTCSTGLTILNCYYMIFFDRSFNFVTENQMEKRIHRIGQHKTTYIIDLVLDKSLELRVMKALETKESIDKNLLKKDYLGKDDWKTFFEGEM